MAYRKKNLTIFPTLSLRDTSVTLLKTNYTNLDFVVRFNRVYGLELARADNLLVKEADHPCFNYYSEAARLAFVMIERPAPQVKAPHFNYYDKMLLIQGRDAWDVQRQLFDDIATAPPEPDRDNYLEHEHWVLLNELKEGIFSIDTFDFRNSTRPATSLFPHPQEVPLPHPTLQYLNSLKAFLEESFELFHWLFGDNEEVL